MAFQASQTVTQIALSPSGCALEIVDTSNYDAVNNPPDPKHSRTYFNKKHLVVTNPDAIEYVMDSVDSPPVSDELIDAPSTGVGADTVQYNFNTNDGNGTYEVEMFTVPTYQANTFYNVDDDHIVYYNGGFYRTTTNANSTDPTFLINWVLVDYAYLRTTSKYYVSTSVVVNCLTSSTYQTSLYDTTDDTYSVEIVPDCSGLRITDASNYSTNTEGGHNLSDFSEFRTITIVRPNGTEYIMSSLSSIDPDEAISAPSSGNQSFTYNFEDGVDQDGRYQIKICSYPTWRNDAAYTINGITVVYYNGTLYKLLLANTGNQPDVSPTYWEEYDLDEVDEYLTRYCYIANVAVLCDISECRQRLLHEAFCLMNTNHCNDDVLCKNPKFLAATKLLVLTEAMSISMSNHQWNEVDDQFNLMRVICNC